MSRRFFDALRKFWEQFTYMSAMEGQPREKWMGDREADFAASRKAFAALEAVWAGDSGDLSRLRELLETSIERYSNGDEDGGTLAWKDSDELQQLVRDKAFESSRLRASNEPEA